MGRHLDCCNGQAGYAGCLVENSSMGAQKLLQYAGLPHAGCSMKKQAGHPVPGRMSEQIGNPIQSAHASGVLDPSFAPDPRNSFLGRQQRNCPAVFMQMVQIMDQSHSSTLNAVTFAWARLSSSAMGMGGV